MTISKLNNRKEGSIFNLKIIYTFSLFYKLNCTLSSEVYELTAQ